MMWCWRARALTFVGALVLGALVLDALATRMVPAEVGLDVVFGALVLLGPLVLGALVLDAVALADLTVGAVDGVSEGDAEGATLVDGAILGTAEGVSDGILEGHSDGDRLGMSEGEREGTSVGNFDGSGDGGLEGDTDGTSEGDSEGEREGTSVGNFDGSGDGGLEGEPVGTSEGDSDGERLGTSEGDADGTSLGDSDGEPDGDELIEGDKLGALETAVVLGALVFFSVLGFNARVRCTVPPSDAEIVQKDHRMRRTRRKMDLVDFMMFFLSEGRGRNAVTERMVRGLNATCNGSTRYKPSGIWILPFSKEPSRDFVARDRRRKEAQYTPARPHARRNLTT
eukprot:Nitzschia sp. Nitz4//scaffold432_size7799//112//1134//NITZ4_009146-RA/size7799-processed-gene-0.24-mRNA-1//1//CDS//3329551814//5220//frame0